MFIHCSYLLDAPPPPSPPTFSCFPNTFVFKTSFEGSHGSILDFKFSNILQQCRCFFIYYQKFCIWHFPCPEYSQSIFLVFPFRPEIFLLSALIMIQASQHYFTFRNATHFLKYFTVCILTFSEVFRLVFWIYIRVAKEFKCCLKLQLSV